jgi:MazG-like nucleotide pyrophosphohydrolase family protein
VRLDEYQKRAFATAQIDWSDARKRHIPTFGVIGELGSLTSELKKTLRDGKAYTDGARNLVEEFGDLLWYLGAIASRHGLDLQAFARRPFTVRSPRSAFGHIYAVVSACAALIAVVPDLGVDLPAAQRRRLAQSLGLAVRTTLHAIQRQDINLNTVLTENLRKVNGAFGDGAVRPARCFDVRFPGYERLPRSIGIHFLERARGPGRIEVVLRVNDLNIGDRLTDNAKRDDGYRYHDAFHLGYAAVLGWSPVVRSTFRCKRKSDAHIDEVQDGARAAIVEEAIAQTVFNYARGHSMLEGLDRIDHNLLKLIQRMVRGLEVRRCALHEWQRAIFVGFEAFRALKRNRGGWLILDAETQSLTYSKEGPVVG